ncbi:phosphatidylinositol alpha-mannosyltransferase [Friedmanniella endophytica]|uniref:Phosphatidylinositol alpha-mannosyltransferase n=1 Tax=Microlunatus kandeliicorticis TaxID=1759536 RepID=A0A7W3ITJ0_9ACTN|nr:glycosyltransferase family 4 protein [Microlunatus kandeliicorticis]MBA8794943.1 phosphatidylinositol alpha-mannosyltransferase [Microlunatus kandeliicorticis]
MTSRRIGLVCPYSLAVPGGVQNHVLGLAGHLTARGHHVEVFAPGSVEPARLAAFGLRGDQLTDAGRTVGIPYNGSVAPVNFGPLSLLRVHRWLRRGRFDLVHVHEPLTPSVAGWALVAARVPVVATFHTATPRSRTMGVAGALLRRTVDRIDAGIAVSATARQVVVQHLGRDARILPNGFRRADFGPRPAARRPGGPRIAFLGRLDEPRKGLEVLLGALPRLRTAHPGLEVVVAGQGHRPLPAWVQAPGRIDDPARAELLGSVDLFVAPHVARESFGIVLVEAMASGAAVVASDLPPFVDLLSGPERLGYQFAAGDADALAEAVLLALDEDRSELVRRARHATRRYDWTRVGAEVEAVYQDVLTGPRSPGPWTGIDPATVAEARWRLRLAARRGVGAPQAAALRLAARALLDQAAGAVDAEQPDRTPAADAADASAGDGRGSAPTPGRGRRAVRGHRSRRVSTAAGRTR